ncbi:Golgi integral membrane protein 4 isoform X1 [Esox lucius]|uniref:Golgi integral membrane protein 4a n=1 Tax=Esox lucius TaxID=8010 RepID=A0AAY5KAF3_ESOLU|nr:Golgi integral membrane protein 4 isoform X1 [Esox lucius]XP_028975099.2 Golgi integral membrane protein 4 isoform X1 [Esox lucius]
MGNGVCSRRQRRIFQSLLLITVVCGIIYGGMISYEMHKQLKRTEAMAIKYQQHQESLSAQLQVVYEHRSRLEKSLQKERVEHKKAKEDYLVYKLEAQQSLNKEKQDSSSRFNSLHVQHQMLKNQHEDLKKQYYDLQEKHQIQGEDHGKALDEHKDRLEKLQQIKELEVSKLKENMYNLREENKQLRKAHQDIHVQLQDARIQHKDLKSAHDQLALTLEDHKSALAAAQVQVEEYKQLKEKLIKMPSLQHDPNTARQSAQSAAVKVNAHEQGQPPARLAQPNGEAHGHEDESRLALQESDVAKPDLQSQPAMSNNAEQEKEGYGEVEGEAERRRELAEEEMEQAGQPQKLEEESDQPQDEDGLEREHDQPDDNALDRQKRQPHTDPQSDIHLIPETHLQQEAHVAKSQVERVKSPYEQQQEQQRLEAERTQRMRELQLHQEALQAQRAREQRDRELLMREQQEREEQQHREADRREQLLKEEQLRKKSHYENMDDIVRGDQDPNVDDDGETDLNLQHDQNEKPDDVDHRVPEGAVEGELDPENDPNNQGEDEFDVAEDQHPHPREEEEEEEEEEKAPVKHTDTHPNHPAVDEELVMAVNPDQQEDNLDEQYQEEGEDEVQEDLGQIRAEEVEDPYNEDNGEHVTLFVALQDEVKVQEVPAGRVGEHKKGENHEEDYEEDEEEVVVGQDKRPNRREM